MRKYCTTINVKRSRHVADMQKQMECMKRQLLETQSQLTESRRKCQQLEAMSQEPTQTVSSHNLNFINVPNSPAIDFTNTFEIQNSQATHTSTYSTAPIHQQNQLQTTTAAFNTYLPSLTNNNMPPFSTNIYASQQEPTTNNINLYGTNEYLMPRKVQDLPEFSGEPEDWPLFFTAYTQSTATYGYTNFENNQRLQKCLKGDTKEMMKSLLIHPDNVNAVIEQLKFRFGRPEQLIHSQLKKVKELPFINPNNLTKLVPFSTKVKNLSVFLKSINGQQHIANPTLLEELVLKLQMNKRLEWAKIARNISPYPTIEHFSDWLSEIANLICMVQDVDNVEPKRRVLYTTERSVQCPICKENHKLFNCQTFLNAKVDDRWSLVKKVRVFFLFKYRTFYSRMS